MSSRRNVAAIVVVCSVTVLFVSIPAYAYIDPNAAGLPSQILTPLLVAVGAGLTFFRRQVRAALHARFPDLIQLAT
jgi:hypothetical protein